MKIMRFCSMKNRTSGLGNYGFSSWPIAIELDHLRFKWHFLCEFRSLGQWENVRYSREVPFGEGWWFTFVISLPLNLIILCHQPAPQLCNKEGNFFAEGQSSPSHFTNNIYNNQADSQDDQNERKIIRQKMNIKCSFYLFHAENNLN